MEEFWKKKKGIPFEDCKDVTVKKNEKEWERIRRIVETNVFYVSVCPRCERIQINGEAIDGGYHYGVNDEPSFEVHCRCGNRFRQDSTGRVLLKFAGTLKMGKLTRS